MCKHIARDWLCVIVQVVMVSSDWLNMKTQFCTFVSLLRVVRPYVATWAAFRCSQEDDWERQREDDWHVISLSETRYLALTLSPPHTSFSHRTLTREMGGVCLMSDCITIAPRAHCPLQLISSLNRYSFSTGRPVV